MRIRRHTPRRGEVTNSTSSGSLDIVHSSDAIHTEGDPSECREKRCWPCFSLIELSAHVQKEIL